MKVAVIIPNWNGERLLPVCLGALREQTVPPDQIILVDNNSTDRSVEVALEYFPDIKVLKLSRNYGFGYAVNRGIEVAGGDLILLLNNDTRPMTNWVEALRDFFSQNTLAMFCACKLLNYSDPSIIDGAGDCLNRAGVPYKIGSARPDSAAYSVPRKVFGASGAAAAFRSAFFHRVGLFDERFFMYLEDVDLSLRAQLQGVECHYLPQAVVHHMEAQSDPDRPAATSNPQTPARTFWITRNRILVLAKNLPTSLLIRYLPAILWGFLKSFAFHLLRTGHVRSYLGGLWRGLSDIRMVWADRRAIQRSIRIPLRHLRYLLEQC
ncbi:MAG: glycosyltransferase family 2 protein [Acidobacteria bacterium]|nr:glycosyltransferase family 2 protein [Acidobacteriota bacterium]